MIGKITRVQMKDGVRWLLVAAVFLVFLKPSVNHTLNSFGIPVTFANETSYAFMSIVAAAVIIAYGVRRRIDIFCAGLIALCVFVTASTIYNCGSLLVVIVDWLPCLATVGVVGLFARSRPRMLLSAFFFSCIFYLAGNLAIFFVDPHSLGFGAVENFLFGYRNVTFRIAIPAFACSLALDALDAKKWSLRSIAVFVLCVFELLVGYSATAVCAFVGMGAVAAASIFLRSRRVLNALTYGFGYVALFVALVVLRIQNGLAFIIEPLLHRSVTFSGRTILWDDAFAHLSNTHFFTGYGTGYLWSELCINGSPQKHAHNEILSALMLGGVGALIALIEMVSLAVGKLFANRRDGMAAALSVGILGYFIVALVEVVSCPGFFYLLAFAYYYFDWGDQNPFAECARHLRVKGRK